MENIWVYDFDGTIYNGDSSIDFFLFCLKKKVSLIRYLPLIIFYTFLYVIRIISTKKYKEMFFSFLKNLSDVDKMGEEFWNKNRIKIKSFFLDDLRKKDRAKICIISASPKFLIDGYTKNLKNVILIATEMDKKTGIINGSNCKGKEKVNEFKKKLKDAKIEKFYGDSKSDEPIAKLAKNSYLVIKEKIYNWEFTSKSKLKINEKEIEMLKFTAIVTTLIMIIAHGFCYFNLLYSHDSLNIIHKGFNYVDSLKIGRFLIPVWTYIRGEYYPPLLIGVLSIIIMILAIYFICKTFSLDKKRDIFVVSLLLCTCSTITFLNATYINYSDMYIFAFFLQILAVYFFKKNNKLSLLTIPILIISFAIYSSYLGVSLGLYIGLLIKDLLNKVDWRIVLKNGIKFVIFVILSLILYILCNKLVIYLCNVSLSNGYNSLNRALKFDSFASLINCFKKTYTSYFKYFFKPYIFHKKIAFILNIFIVLVAIYLMIKKMVKINSDKNTKPNIFLIILLCLVIPFALNVIYFITNGVVHGLMIFAINVTYIYIICLISKEDKSLISKAVYVVLIIIGFLNVAYSNQIYEKKKMEFDSTINILNRVVMKVEDVDNYEAGKTEVILIGNLNDGLLVDKKQGFDYSGVGQKSVFATTFNRNTYRFIKYFLGTNMNIVDKDLATSPIAKEYSKKDEVKQMPSYPTKGSIKMIDNYLIIKFS